MSEPSYRFLMAGGGTAGHVMPALAVARELRSRGHLVVFAGTREGLEAKLVPEAGFEIRFLKTGGLQRVGYRKALRTLLRLPAGLWQARRLLLEWRPDAVFSMGGYVAAPAVLAAAWLHTPVVAMEPNAFPGFTNRHLGRFSDKILIHFAETAQYFPRGRTEITGVPVREEFFSVPSREPGEVFSVLITGGSRGSRTLNRAFRESWPCFRGLQQQFRFLHQCGKLDYEELKGAFENSGLAGEVVDFIEDMPSAYAAADLVVSRAGAGAVAELAAAGKPSILVPFPFAAGDHQTRNAAAMVAAGAALLVPDGELTGDRLCREVSRLAADRELLRGMGRRARGLSRRGASTRAAEILIECAARSRRLTGLREV